MKPSPLSLRSRGGFVFSLTPALVCGMTGAIDSGGGVSGVGTWQNHASSGEPFGTSRGMAGSHGVYRGLVEVLYPPLAADPEEDSDGNGLPDWWELNHFGDLGVDPGEDADADGTSNEMEFLALTDPRDPVSVFRPACYRDGNALVVPMQTKAGRIYLIEGSPDLDNWSLLESLGGDGSFTEWEYLLGDPDDLPYFLRIEIVLP